MTLLFNFVIVLIYIIVMMNLYACFWIYYSNDDIQAYMLENSSEEYTRISQYADSFLFVIITFTSVGYGLTGNLVLGNLGNTTKVDLVLIFIIVI